MGIQFLDHTADTAVRITASTPAGLLSEAARGLLAIILGEEGVSGVRLDLRRTLELEAPDGEALIVDLLSELIFLFDTEGLLVRELAVQEATFGPPARLVAALRGELLDPARHRARTEVKAATHHGIHIERTDAGLTVDVVFDL